MTIQGPVDSEILARIPIFAGLNETQRQEVIALGEIRILAPGDMLLREGQKSQDLWVLLEGCCEVLKRLSTPAGPAEPTLLAVLEPFSTLGEMSFFHAAPHSASVRAKTALKLFRLPRTRFDELLARAPGTTSLLAINTIASLADRMRRMDEWVVELLAHKPPDPRIPEWNEMRRLVFDGWKL